MTMQSDDFPGYETLRLHFADLMDSPFDPPSVATALLAAGIVGKQVLFQAKQLTVDEGMRRTNIVSAVQANGAPRVFQSFVEILRKNPANHAICGKLKATYKKQGGVWLDKEMRDSRAAPSTSTHPVAVDGEEATDESIGASAAVPSISTPSQPLGGSAPNTIPSQPLGRSAADLEQPKFSLDDDYDEPLALPQGAHEKIKKMEDFAKNEVRIVIQSCNKAEYRATLEMLKPFQDFNAPVKHSDVELDIIVGIFAGQNTAIVRTATGAKCIKQLKRAFEILQNAKILLGLGICYGIKDNARKKDLQFADVLVGHKIGISEAPKLQSGGVDPREDDFKEIPNLMYNIFCRDSAEKWDEFTVCEVREQRTAKVYVGRLCSASLLMNDPDRMEKIKAPWRLYLGGEMEGWAQFEIADQCIIIKGISDFADGKKNDKWQLTAAKAAVSYAHYMLEKFGYIKYEQIKTPSF